MQEEDSVYKGDILAGGSFVDHFNTQVLSTQLATQLTGGACEVFVGTAVKLA